MRKNYSKNRNKINKGIIIFTVLFTSLCLMSCRNKTSAIDSYSDSGSAFTSNSVSGLYEPSFNTGGDYSNTNISGDKTDYSYNFYAGGKTNKNKEEMLSDFERIRDFIEEKGGYISNVNNDYSYYDIENDGFYRNSIDYQATGSIYFNAEVNNEDIPDVINLLETICKENHFTVDNYKQQITNYEAYDISNENDDYSKVITEKELNKRLRFAELNVSISYKIPRTWIVKIYLTVKDIIVSFFNSFGDVIKAFLAIAVGLFILFLQFIFFYKKFKKMTYKFRLKHPEYYSEIKHVIVHSCTEEKQNIEVRDEDKKLP